MTGATGFIGRALLLRLGAHGHDVAAWVRDEKRARSLLGAEASLVAAAGGLPAMRTAVARADAVINLAGEPVASRWTRRRREAIRASRVDLTRDLVTAIATAPRRPGVLVSASAIGHYGDGGDTIFDENGAPGTGFLAELCADWERAALAARASGVRVVIPRIGVVLGPDGGALPRLLPLFRMGLGGPTGSGMQWLSWIHYDDLVSVLVACLDDPLLEGPINAVAPGSVRSRDFAAALGRAIGRRASLRMPAVALRAVLGEASSVLLGGQRVVPKKLAAAGHTPRFTTIDEALGDLVGGSFQIAIQPMSQGAPAPLAVPGSSYLERRRATYLLRATTRIDRPAAEVFAFFSRAENLGLITPADMSFRVLSAPAEIATGAKIDHSVRVGGTRLAWRTSIEDFSPGHHFVDAQERGPYRAWWHEHHVRSVGPTTTVMEDRVYYAPPFGWLGRLANRLFIARQLRRIFSYRERAIRLRFGTDSFFKAT